MRRDKSFADDLVVQPGRVSSRVALLLRAAERKPVCCLDLSLTSPIDFDWPLLRLKKREPVVEGEGGSLTVVLL